MEDLNQACVQLAVDKTEQPRARMKNCVHIWPVSPGDKGLGPQCSQGQEEPAQCSTAAGSRALRACWVGAQTLWDCGCWQPLVPEACCAVLTLSSQGRFPKAPWWLAVISERKERRGCVYVCKEVGEEYQKRSCFSKNFLFSSHLSV